MYTSILFACIAAAVAVPLEERQAAAPSVTIRNGTVVGASAFNVDSFRGVPFANPPTGTNRLRSPSALARPFGTIQATGVPNACPQFAGQINTTGLPPAILPLVQFPPVQPESEDCLTLNIQRPSGTTGNSRLPVLVWFFGGAFEFGASQQYDGTSIIARSGALGQPIIYIALNYRLGGFGFLAGRDLQNERNTNLGLKDQRLALQWIQENIVAFGGDPSKVTIWGESAGAISVFDQTVINGGDNRYGSGRLFRGAIMDSGSVVPTLDVASPKAQGIYDTVLRNAGCANQADHLGCLRRLPFADFRAAANSVPNVFSYRSLDLSYLPRPDPRDNFFSASPEVSVLRGAFTKVPIIIGDQEDEGTIFVLSLSNVTTQTDLVNYLQTYYPNANRGTIQGLVNLYPDDPAAGSPFNTGPANELYPGFKRNAALLGDTTFTLARRNYLGVVSNQVRSWSYLASYFYGTPFLGTFHASDVVDIYFGVQPVPQTTHQTYYISFVNNLDPNAITTAPPLINWPQWTLGRPQLNNFQVASNTLINDTFRLPQSIYLAAQAPSGQFRI